MRKRSKPKDDDDVKSLKNLNEDVLAVVVSQAETMLASQFQSHLASEQRGFALSGIAIAASSAVFASTLTNTSLTHDYKQLALFFALGLFLSGTISIVSIWPRKFSIPGNEPKNWLPEHWQAGSRNMKATRIEQATVLQAQISGNRKTSKRKANLQQASILVAYLTILACGTLWVYEAETVIASTPSPVSPHPPPGSRPPPR